MHICNHIHILSYGGRLTLAIYGGWLSVNHEKHTDKFNSNPTIHFPTHWNLMFILVMLLSWVIVLIILLIIIYGSQMHSTVYVIQYKQWPRLFVYILSVTYGIQLFHTLAVKTIQDLDIFWITKPKLIILHPYKLW